MNSYLLFISLLSLTFIAYARMSTPGALSLSWKRFWKLSKTESFGFDDEKIRPETQSLFLSNSLISFSLSTYLFLLTYFDRLDALGLMVMFVFSCLGFQLLNFRLALFLTDNWKLVGNIAEINKQVWSFVGLVYLSLSFLWLIYGQSNPILKQAYIVIFVAAYSWRLIKAWRACIQANLEWYYLILYLCTLEILPILFVWRWLSGEYN
jgi:VanZ family protein